jgi:pyridoxamine 5'-phosphate oxidase
MENTPFKQFGEWMKEARASEPNDSNAMTLATVSAAGRPAARIVLLKAWDERGFVFYTNLESRKSSEIRENAQVALLFHWKSLRRQVRIEGVAEAVSAAEADAYFASRARVSRLGAIASEQSRPLPDRGVFERRVAELDALYPGDIPRPAHWSGTRVVPATIEFWQDMPFRLHDRTVFHRTSEGWSVVKLYP